MKLLWALLKLIRLGRREPITPVLKGYEGLLDRFEKQLARQEQTTKALEAELTNCVRGRKQIAKSTGRALGALKRKIDECEEDRDQLRARQDRQSLEIEELKRKRLEQLPEPPRRTTRDQTNPRMENP